MPRRFNVRVYALLIENDRVLLSDEYIKGMKITKFPGGGLEYGEGLIDGLKREMIEELNLETEIISHFYTTDFFVASAFDPSSQVISVYYLVRGISKSDFPVSESPHNYKIAEGAQSLRWIALDKLSEDDLTLIIDKKVAAMLIDQYKSVKAP